ncbi:MAG: hypothetical protein R3190_19965 [Thermoanaerobaculia bacterium]|nr:hypothetical protein [Thermoanaerobaculia bacterium]
MSFTTLAFLLLLAQPAAAAADPATPPEPESGPEVRFYGLLKVDAAYDTACTVPGNFVKWVELEPDNPDDDGFHLTANQSRLGIEVTDLAGRTTEAGARFEIDFYGGGPENRSEPMLRHAYFRVGWPKRGLELLAGQTSDLFSPLSPPTLNYSVAWFAGNIGYRRPQIRLTHRSRPGDGIGFELAGAIARTISDLQSDFVPVDAGVDAGVPGVQGRLGVDIPRGGDDSLRLGLSGHWSQEELDTSAQGEATDFDSWSLNLDFSTALGRRTRLQGELFEGANLTAYLGGIGQGVNLDRMQEIGSRGGWTALAWEDGRRLALSFGGSLEQVESDDVESGDRESNRSLYATAIYSLTPAVRLGVELSHWRTGYKDRGDADDFRTQLSLMYDF